jgi:hypothetical protein
MQAHPPDPLSWSSCVSGRCEPEWFAVVRLQGRLHSGVKVPVRPKYHRPVTEGYCVVATRGGELPEVNCQSVTPFMNEWTT